MAEDPTEDAADAPYDPSAYVDHAARLLGLTIAPGNRAAVVADFRDLMDLAEAVRGAAGVPPDDPLTLFRP